MASQAILSHQLFSSSPPSPRLNPNPNPTSLLLPLPRLLAPWFLIPRRRLKLRPLTVSSSSSSAAAPVNREHLDSLERCLSISSDSGVASCSAAQRLQSSGPRPAGKKGRGGALSTLRQRPQIEIRQTSEPKLLDVATGGGGGDIGKKIGHGGGDGGDDDDDDNYFDDFDDDDDEGGEGGLFRRRIVLKEVGKV